MIFFYASAILMRGAIGSSKFLQAIVSLWVAAIIGSWCNFLTVMYIGEFPIAIADRFMFCRCNP